MSDIDALNAQIIQRLEEVQGLIKQAREADITPEQQGVVGMIGYQLDRTLHAATYLRDQHLTPVS